MTRRDALATLGGLAASAGLAGRASGQEPGEGGEVPLSELIRKAMPMMASIPMKSEPLGPGLTMVSGPGGNVLVVAGADGLVAIDSFVPGRGADTAATLRKLGEGPITLVDTHWHFDHAGGNAGLAAIGARIVAHENCRKRLGADQYMVDIGLKVPASPPAALPVVTFDDTLTLHLNGEEIHLAHFPSAHTDGDVFIHLRRANVLHAGDLFANGIFPAIDSSSGGWIGGMVAASDRLIEVADAKTRIIPGHGPLATVADLKAARAMLAEARERVEPLVAAGKSVDEVVAAKPLASLDARWGHGLLRSHSFTRMVYSGLANHLAASKPAGR